MAKKKKGRSPHKAAPDRRKFVNFFLDVLKDVLAAILAALILNRLGL